MNAAERSAEHASARDLAMLIKSTMSSRASEARFGAVLSYCHNHGWPFGTRGQPACEKWAQYVAEAGGIARFKQAIRALVPNAFDHREATKYVSDVLAISTACQTQGWPHRAQRGALRVIDY
jgi:hypothetical protein